MTQIASTNSATAAKTTTSGAPLINPGSMLDKDDFLKLFVTQLQHQDPMAPMDNDQMVSQMSQLSSVEQMTNLASSNAQMALSLANANAIGLIGRTVSWTDKDDAVHSGVVEKVSTIDGKPSLTVAGTPGVDPSTITQVA
jgi:flagellar basal-body rod modification protein FlgD